MQSFKDPNAVASIVDALRHAHGDAIARLMLIKGLTLADLIESLLRSPIKNREAIKLANHALGSGDFPTEPQIGGTSHDHVRGIARPPAGRCDTSRAAAPIAVARASQGL